MDRKRLLIVDDELHTREALSRYLRRRFEVAEADDGAAAIDILKKQDFDLVLTDLRMPGADGMSVLEATRSKAKQPGCIVFTAYGTIENAVAAVKAGAVNFVTKPVRLDQLDAVIDDALARRENAKESREQETEKQPGTAEPLTASGELLVGDSEPMREVMKIVRDAAPSRINILLTGESGTGKEVIARAIHDLSGRTGLFVPVHCAALPANLLESELFGHEKGAFTGAVESRKGRFELADGGTIFLDEIGEIDLSVQVKLLRVIETRTIERLGGATPIKCDARLLAATNRNLAELVRTGQFREDLYYRLDGIDIELPPLRERSGDIPALATRFIALAARDNNRQVDAIAPEAQALLNRYDWPGNIRELRSCIERMVVLAHHRELTPDDLPPHIRDFHPESRPRTATPDAPAPAPGEEPIVRKLGESERELIERALTLCQHNRTRAAEKLGISRRTLHRRLREYEQEDNEREKSL